MRWVMRIGMLVIALGAIACLEPPTHAPGFGRPGSRVRMMGTGNCGDDPSLSDHGVSVHAVYGMPDRDGAHPGYNHARIELHNTSAEARHVQTHGAVISEVGPEDRCDFVAWPLDRTLAPNEAVAFDVEMRIDDAPAGQVFTVSLPVIVDGERTCTDVASFVAVRPHPHAPSHSPSSSSWHGSAD